MLSERVIEWTEECWAVRVLDAASLDDVFAQ